MILPGDPRLDALRKKLSVSISSASSEEWEWELLEGRARHHLETGVLPPWQSGLTVRVAGEGVHAHRLPVRAATQILDALQCAITAVGGALVQESKGDSPAGGVRKATQFLMTPRVTPGSIVFHLEREAEPSDKDSLVPDASVDTLADRSLLSLINLLMLAEEDSPEQLGLVTGRLRTMGVRTASNLAKLIKELRDRDLEVALGQVTNSGARHSAQLNERGCSVIREALERNREVVDETTITGTLNTASDGSDKIRLTTDDGATVRLIADSERGAGMGAWIGENITVRAQKRTKWSLGSGKETVTLELIDAELTSDVPLPL